VKSRHHLPKILFFTPKKPMESVVSRQLRGRDPAELEELTVEDIKAPHIVGLDGRFVNLKTLSLIGLGLQSLDNFPTLPLLKKVRLFLPFLGF